MVMLLMNLLCEKHLSKAQALLLSLSEISIGAMAIVDRVRHLNRHAYILVRTKHVADIEELYKLGANQVVPEEF